MPQNVAQWVANIASMHICLGDLQLIGYLFCAATCIKRLSRQS